jgi:hypothetical protein
MIYVFIEAIQEGVTTPSTFIYEVYLCALVSFPGIVPNIVLSTLFLTSLNVVLV